MVLILETTTQTDTNMPWKVKIDDKEICASECPYKWNSPMYQLCTYSDEGNTICHDYKNCPIALPIKR